MNIGTCSLCGGAVKENGTVKDDGGPRCSQCGATPVNAYGPVIPMRPPALTEEEKKALAQKVAGMQKEATLEAVQTMMQKEGV